MHRKTVRMVYVFLVAAIALTALLPGGGQKLHGNASSPDGELTDVPAEDDDTADITNTIPRTVEHMHAYKRRVLEAGGVFGDIADAARSTWPYLSAAVFISADAGAAIWVEAAKLHRIWAGVAFATSDVVSMVYDVTVGLVGAYLAPLESIAIFAICRSLVVVGGLAAAIAAVFLGRKLWTCMGSAFWAVPQRITSWMASVRAGSSGTHPCTNSPSAKPPADPAAPPLLFRSSWPFSCASREAMSTIGLSCPPSFATTDAAILGPRGISNHDGGMYCLQRCWLNAAFQVVVATPFRDCVAEFYTRFSATGCPRGMTNQQFLMLTALAQEIEKLSIARTGSKPVDISALETAMRSLFHLTQYEQYDAMEALEAVQEALHAAFTASHPGMELPKKMSGYDLRRQYLCSNSSCRHEIIKEERCWNLRVPILIANSSADVVAGVKEYKAAVLKLHDLDKNISFSETIPDSLLKELQAAELSRSEAEDKVAEALVVEARGVRDILVEEGASTELECSLRRNFGRKLAVAGSCSNCGQRTLVESVNISKMPETLVVSISRYRQGSSEKSTRRFSFPLDELTVTADDAAESGDSKTETYFATAIIRHTGTVRFGHYTAYVRQSSAVGSLWWDCNDQRVTSVPASAVEDGAATIVYLRTPSCVGGP